MTTCRRGDVVLVDLVFTQGGGSKKRPALVMSSAAYHRSRQEIIVAAITSNVERLRVGDTKVKEWRDAGLLFASLVTAILQTVKRPSVAKRLGRLSVQDFKAVEANLRKALDLQ